MKIETRIFDTEEEATDWKEWYLNKFHPEGYGTSVVIKRRADGQYEATARRAKSCG